MLQMTVTFKEPAFPELEKQSIIHLKNSIKVAGLDGGMTGGKPSVAFCFELPDGKFVLAETSLTLFLTAADALKAKFGDPRE